MCVHAQVWGWYLGVCVVTRTGIMRGKGEILKERGQRNICGMIAEVGITWGEGIEPTRKTQGVWVQIRGRTQTRMKYNDMCA